MRTSPSDFKGEHGITIPRSFCEILLERSTATAARTGDRDPRAQRTKGDRQRVRALAASCSTELNRLFRARMMGL